MTQTKNLSIGAFTDCYEVLDRAVASNRGIIITCKSPGAAISLRQRLYSARKTLSRHNGQAGDFSTIYDSILIQIDPQRSDKLIIKKRSMEELQITIETLDGEPIEDQDDLTCEAAALRERLNLNDLDLG